jgi:predicted DNA-binding transcriptional regulator YafY
MVALRHAGVSLADIVEEFSCSYRTAQRMTQALEIVFQGVMTRVDDSQRKFWFIDRYDKRIMTTEGLQDTEIIALDMAVRRVLREGATNEAEALKQIKDRILLAASKAVIIRAESDAEAILEAQGYACRPGPKIFANKKLLTTISEALRGPFVVSILYETDCNKNRSERLVQPYGLILGTRKYLVAKIHDLNGKFRNFRLDRIRSMQLKKETFNRESGFNLDNYTAKAFGSFHSVDEYAEVVWRFTKEAATVAREFIFHPNQMVTEESDGSLLVRFFASGHIEMAWHLYCWGDSVEVLEPKGLRQLVSQHKGNNFKVFP